MKKEKVLFVIPAYNEEASILKTYNQIKNYNKKNKTNYDVIVINDGSTDNSEEKIKKYCEEYNSIIRYYVKENGMTSKIFHNFIIFQHAGLLNTELRLQIYS